MAKKELYDFCGYVTKNDIKCSDGRIIRNNAFADCDGNTVPLVWQHLRDSPKNVIGNIRLENREDGVYGYGKFNNTELGVTSKELVRHGDINSMSIYANRLKQTGSNVTHGVIREVSLVYAPANPGALIDNITITHSDGEEVVKEDEAVIYSGEDLEHSDGVVVEFKDDEEFFIHEEEDDDEDESDKSVTAKEVFESLSNDQKALFYAMVGAALEENSESDDDVTHSDMNEGGIDMSYNVFEGRDATPSISHADKVEMFKKVNTYAIEHNMKLSKAFDEFHDEALEHGITDIESLFPDYRSLNNPPEWIGKPEAWVNTVWNGTAKTPFSRVKSAFADITKDEARARGYIKGKKKEEEQFSLLKRTTDPQTVYKLQKLDRDDVLDITDYDVVAWLKAEMRMKLEEELSRAILIGDGRLASDEGKIQENHIRSILNEDPFYSIKYEVDLTDVTDTTDRANAVIDAAAYAMIEYKGSGGVTAFMSPKTLADMRVAKDKNGRRLYTSTSEIASALGVSNIVEVPLMKDVTRTDSTTSKTYSPLAILVNLRDYNVGADRGGQTTMFDDFDLNYNKYEYLIETRCSGALIRPYSAIVLEVEAAESVG